MPAADGMPRPDDLGRAPLWALYVNRQAVQASLGRLPEHLLAFGVGIDELRVELRFQLSEITAADVADMQEIQEDLDLLTGFILDLDRVVEVRQERYLARLDGTWWLYLVRVPFDEELG